MIVAHRNNKRSTNKISDFKSAKSPMEKKKKLNSAVGENGL